jgi:hypothetical protein
MTATIDDDPCPHRWVWVDHLNAFVCLKCHEVDDAQ